MTTQQQIEKLIIEWLKSDNENTTYLAHKIFFAINNYEKGMKLRLEQYPEGWIVEYLEYSWSLFGLKKEWTFLTRRPVTDSPIFATSPDEAKALAIDQLKINIDMSFYAPQFYK